MAFQVQKGGAERSVSRTLVPNERKKGTNMPDSGADQGEQAIVVIPNAEFSCQTRRKREAREEKGGKGSPVSEKKRRNRRARAATKTP